MNTYLDDEKIQGCIKYLKSVLNNETLEVVRRLSKEKNMNLFENEETNKKIYWDFIAAEIYNQNSETGINFRKIIQEGQYFGTDNYITTYITKNYKDEYYFICNKYKINDIKIKLESLFKENNLDAVFSLKELIYSESFESYFEKLSIKTIDKNSLKEAVKMTELIDAIYGTKRGEDNYNTYENAIKQYRITGDIQLFFNILNKTDK